MKKPELRPLIIDVPLPKRNPVFIIRDIVKEWQQSSDNSYNEAVLSFSKKKESAKERLRQKIKHDSRNVGFPQTGKVLECLITELKGFEQQCEEPAEQPVSGDAFAIESAINTVRFQEACQQYYAHELKKYQERFDSELSLFYQ